MDHLFPGVLTVTLCALLYLLAFRQYKKAAYGMAIGLIILSGCLLRIYVAGDPFLHPWDERYHALVAKNMIAFPFRPMLYQNPVLTFDFRSWSSNHIWVHKQPIPLWLMAASMKAMGTNLFALRLPSVLLSTLAIGLTYKIASELFNKKVGILAAFLHSINGLIIELTGGRVATDHYDLMFLCFIELGIFLSLLAAKRNNYGYAVLTGLSVGLAILTKWLPALIVFPIYGCFLCKESYKLNRILGHLVLAAIICLITFVPWQWYIHSVFPTEAAWESSFNAKHIFEVLDGHFTPWYFHFNRLTITYGEVVFIPLIALIYLGVRRYQSKNWWYYLALNIWIFVPVLFFTFVQTRMQAYTIFIAPAVFISIGLFIRFLQWNNYRLRNKWLSHLILILLIALPIRYTFERVKPFKDNTSVPEWQQEIMQFEASTNDLSRVLVFNEAHNIEFMFHHDVEAAYPHLPNQEQLNELLATGYIIYIKNEEGIYQRYTH